MIAPDFSDRAASSLLSLRGRTAVITGGGNGIGLAIARRCAEAGADICLADLDRDSADAACEVIRREYGASTVALASDASSEREIVELATVATATFGKIDIWVNNAAIYPVQSSLEVTADDWDRVHSLNLRGAFLASREAAQRMVAAGNRGVIINIASVSGLRARTRMAAYVASKHGMIGLTKTLAAEWGSKGVRVLAIAPSLTATPGMTTWRENLGGGNADAAARRMARAAAEMPMGRFGLPDDVARVVLFCASDLSVMMTGCTLTVDGGAMCVG